MMRLTNHQCEKADELKALIASSDEQRIHAGILLMTMKAECKHGQWLSLLERAGVGERRAQRLMAKVRYLSKCVTVSDLGIMELLRGAIDEVDTIADREQRIKCLVGIHSLATDVLLYLEPEQPLQLEAR